MRKEHRQVLMLISFLAACELWSLHNFLSPSYSWRTLHIFFSLSEIYVEPCKMWSSCCCWSWRWFSQTMTHRVEMHDKLFRWRVNDDHDWTFFVLFVSSSRPSIDRSNAEFQFHRAFSVIHFIRYLRWDEILIFLIVHDDEFQVVWWWRWEDFLDYE